MRKPRQQEEDEDMVVDEPDVLGTCYISEV